MTDFDAIFDTIFKAYDVRGLVDTQIDPTSCFAIGRSFAQFATQQGFDRIVVGRDMRPSGAELSKAFCEGAMSAIDIHKGVNVTDIGLCATEMVYYASGIFKIPGAMFTASHNPAEYNGIKFCGAGASALTTELIDIKNAAIDFANNAPPNPTDLVATTVPNPLAPNPLAVNQGQLTEIDLLPDFVTHVTSFLTPSSTPDTPFSSATIASDSSHPLSSTSNPPRSTSQPLRSTPRPLRIVIDAGNGMAGMVAPAILSPNALAGTALEGTQVEYLYDNLDGTFPNHPPNPLEVENLRDLQQRVLEIQADLGLGYDGDADRVFAVDEQGKPVTGSTLTALLANALLKRFPGATVVHNAICSRSVSRTIKTAGGGAVPSRVGHTFMKQSMADHNAIFGGEHSGHFYFGDCSDQNSNTRNNFGADSSMIATVLVLEAIANHAGTFSSLLAPFQSHYASGELNTSVSDTAAVINSVSEHYQDAQQSRLDGLTVDFDDWWFNLRPSNTEPLLRLNVEVTNADALDNRITEVQGLLAVHG